MSIAKASAKDQAPLEGAVPDDLIEAAEQALEGARSAGGHQAKLVDIAELVHSKRLYAQIPGIRSS
jgi:hypothetical protein